MTGPGQRPAVSLWARVERERQMVRSVQEAEWRRRMLRAGNIDPADLSDQALRILAWLAEWDDWTVDGVAELLTAARRAGREAACPGTDPTARRDAEHPTAADAVGVRLAAVREPQDTNQEVGQ